MKYLIAVAIVLFGVVQATQARPARLTLTDLGSEVKLPNSGVALSPDGKLIAAVVARYDFVDNRLVNSLLLIDAITGAQRELAHGRVGIGSPQWSPDGQSLAWLDSAQGGTPQVYAIEWRNAGARAAAITRASNGVQSFSWNPDGTAIAFLTPDSVAEKAGEQRHNGAFEVRAESFLARAATVPSHVWIASINDGEPRRVTSGAASVTGFQWAQGGRSIAYLTQPEPDLIAELAMIDVATGDSKVLIDRVARQPILALFPVSPDGSTLAYLRPRGPEAGFRAEGVVLHSLTDGVSNDIVAATDRSFGWNLLWQSDGRGVISKFADKTRDVLWLQPLDAPGRRLDVGEVTAIGGMSSNGRALAFIGTGPRRPAEIYYKASADAKPKRLTHFNDHLAALDLGQTATVNWRSDGMEHSGVLIYPPGFDRRHKYPLVLEIHGGPMSHYNEAFNPFHQLLAAQGWIVFCPDYRGGDAQDDAYRRAIINDTADGPVKDVMAGIEAVKALGIVDESRMAVSGWSYGGFMSAQLSARYPIWRAAVVGAAVTDWVDQYSLSDQNVFFGYTLGGSPWTDAKVEHYRRQSPIALARHSGTPTLILANTGDARVPITQSYKWYRALKDNNVPVKFVAYPIDSHSVLDPVQRHDTYRRWVGWIEEHFRGDFD